MNLLVISGGRHPYEESTPILEKFLTASRHNVTVNRDSNVLSDASEMRLYDALIFNTKRVEETALTKAEQNGVKEFIENGKGFICIHISGCAQDTWPEFQEITGGGWNINTSYHPPYQKFTVTIKDTPHPVMSGISDFTTNDELYMGIDYKSDNDVLIEASSIEGTYQWRGKPMYMPKNTFPLGWTRTFGMGKVFVTLLGHNGLSFKTAEFQKMILNGINWVTT